MSANAKECSGASVPCCTHGKVKDVLNVTLVMGDGCGTFTGRMYEFPTPNGPAWQTDDTYDPFNIQSKQSPMGMSCQTHLLALTLVCAGNTPTGFSLAINGVGGTSPSSGSCDPLSLTFSTLLGGLTWTPATLTIAG